MPEISHYDDVIDSRDVIARIEELEAERDEFVLGAPDGTETPNPEGWTRDRPEDAAELAALQSLAQQASGYADDWHHGTTLIRDSYFTTYAQEFAEDIGAVKDNAEWPYTCIDWEAAAKDLQSDYTYVEFDGIDYWVR